jgi:hypothetical protein
MLADPAEDQRSCEHLNNQTHTVPLFEKENTFIGRKKNATSGLNVYVPLMAHLYDASQNGSEEFCFAPEERKVRLGGST